MLIYALLSWAILTFIYVSRRPPKVDEVKTKLIRATEVMEKNIIKRNGEFKGKYKIAGNAHSTLLDKQLSTNYLKQFPEVYKFLKRKLDLKSFDLEKCLTIRSSDPYNVEVLSDNSLELYMNLHEINDIRRINYYFIQN